MDRPPFAQLRMRVDFCEPEREYVEVVVEGEPVARLHPVSVAYKKDWGNGGPARVTAEFHAGAGEFETRPPRSDHDRA